MISVIKVPDFNDSFSRVVLSGKEYLIRFSYNFEGDYWTFGIYDHNRSPYVPVSYTHLDVYKRQTVRRRSADAISAPAA